MTEKIKVLIAEDDALISNDIASLLRANGFEVVGIAHNEKRCFNLLKRFEVDLAILDIHMTNERSGVNIANHINQHYRIPFVFLTSFSDEETLRDAYTESPFGYLVKPYQEATLLTTLRLALNIHNNRKKKLDFEKLNSILTKTELLVCEKLCTSLTYNEIAEGLFVSINTVRFHAKNIYFKLNINSRSELLNLLIS